ncbi:DUF433 domain-containing protein [Chitinimonas arctica]|uniref:DUF433 domain-containing protein n=1 Tax=Chitinimonas arctica TaxID=2594795 RepID=A0A516SBR4_9NEIS|nr:DUF433 domain-containing protein [Chitinimonas arctica]QDQ25589.1 DUF433 domain-containing protein [Chitinimonas arctica]
MYMNRITSNPAVMMGKPVIDGTRITVENILDRLAAGESIEQVCEALPRVQLDDVRAALDFASGLDPYQRDGSRSWAQLAQYMNGKEIRL